jgi:hypothetical protein
MKLIIAGSRSITDYTIVKRAINRLLINPTDINEIVSGTARGVDRLGERYAKEHGIKITKFPANWNKYGKRAGYLRNEQMAKYADVLIAI